jgi:hypothetical protein
LKKKSCKIQRLELVSDKIEVRDSRRKVVCIRFGHPSKKMALVGALHGMVAMVELELHEWPWWTRFSFDIFNIVQWSVEEQN